MQEAIEIVLMLIMKRTYYSLLMFVEKNTHVINSCDHDVKGKLKHFHLRKGSLFFSLEQQQLEMDIHNQDEDIHIRQTNILKVDYQK